MARYPVLSVGTVYTETMGTLALPAPPALAEGHPEHHALSQGATVALLGVLWR